MTEYKFPPLTGKWLPPQNPVIIDATIEDQEEFIKNAMSDSLLTAIDPRWISIVHEDGGQEEIGEDKIVPIVEGAELESSFPQVRTTQEKFSLSEMEGMQKADNLRPTPPPTRRIFENEALPRVKPSPSEPEYGGLMRDQKTIPILVIVSIVSALAILMWEFGVFNG